MKPDAPAKAGPAPPAEADGNCDRSGRGSLQGVVVRKLTTCGTLTRTGRAVKRAGATGAASHRQAVLWRARPRVNTCPEPGRPNPPASTRSPVLVGRTEREWPGPPRQTPDRPPNSCRWSRSTCPTPLPPALPPAAPTLCLLSTFVPVLSTFVPVLFHPGWGATLQKPARS